MQYNKSQSLMLAHSVKGQMSFRHGALSVHNLPKSLLGLHYYSDQPLNRSDHRRIVPAIQEYDAIGLSKFNSTQNVSSPSTRIVGSLRNREVACSTSDLQGLNFQSCVSHSGGYPEPI